MTSPEFNVESLFNTGSLGDFTKLARYSWNSLLGTMQLAQKDLGERVIETIIEGEENIKYKTTFKMDGDIINEFPSNIPDTNNLYWKRHIELVDKVLQERKDLVNKVIDTTGTAITKVISPISFSTVDILKLAELFKK
jgi:hypothetical protein